MSDPILIDPRELDRLKAVEKSLLSIYADLRSGSARWFRIGEQRDYDRTRELADELEELWKRSEVTG